MEHVDLLIFCDDPGHGGTAIVTTDLAVELARCGQKIVYVAPESSSDLASTRSDAGIINFDISPDFATSVDKKLYSRSEIIQALMVFQADRILLSVGAYFSSIAAMDVLAERNVPYSVWLHLVDECSHTEVLKSSDRIKLALHRAHHIVTVSDANARLLRQILPDTEFRLKTIPNGRPQRYFDPVPDQEILELRHTLKLPASSRVALMVARYEPRKGYDRLIEAVRRLSDRGNLQNLHILAIGADPANLRSAYTNRIQSLGLAKFFTLLGPQQNPRSFYGLSDMLVLPSAAEGMPLTVSEAMAQGKPVIASAVSGIPEQLGTTNTLLPDPNEDEEASIDHLSAALERHIADREYALAQGESGRQRALARFSMPAMVEGHNRYLKWVPRKKMWRTETFTKSRETLRPGEFLDFGEPETTSHYRIKGWSDCEAGAIWSIGTRSILELPLPQKLQQPAKIILEFGGFVPPEAPPIAITIHGNDQPIGSFPLAIGEPGQVRILDLPNLVDPRRLGLVFEIDHPRAPADYGLGRDSRKLGLHLQRLGLLGVREQRLVTHLAVTLSENAVLSLKGRSVAAATHFSVPALLASELEPILSVLHQIMDPTDPAHKSDLFTEKGLTLLSSSHPAFKDDRLPLPLLFLAIYFARADLKKAFDIQTENGRRGLLCWGILHGLHEHGLQELLSERSLKELGTRKNPIRFG